MSRAGRKTRRLRRQTTALKPTLSTAEFLKNRLMNPDPRSHAEFLADMRAEQSFGQLVNPATAALLDRLERATA